MVATMFQGGNGELSSRKLHPFFTKPDPAAPEDHLPSTPSTTSPSITAGPKNSVPESQNEEPQRKRRKVDVPLADDDDESEPKKQRRKTKSQRNTLTGAILNHLTKPQQPPSSACQGTDRVKKIPSPPLSEVSPRLDDEGEAAGNRVSDASHENTPRTRATAQPKKVLKLNSRTGTIGPPPRSKRSPKPSRIVCIKYGKDIEDRKRIGDRISQILQGKGLPSAEQPSKTKAKAMVKTDKTKNAHPFFSKAKSESSAKAAHPTTKSSVEKHSVFTSTPISPRKPRNVFSQGKAFQFGMRSFGAKVPGAMHPLWPPQGMNHIRGEEVLDIKPANYPSSPNRKSKGLVTSIAPYESLVNCIVDSLNLSSMRKSFAKDADNFDPAPAELRLPQRHFESGRKLKSRIRSQVQARFVDKPLYEDSDFSPDELAGPQVSSRAHPALEGLYKSLDTQLSAYDRSTCETLAWAQKYSPVTAAQVLQRGREALLLRDWLRTLRVQSVESGTFNDEKDKAKAEGGAKKRRKKNKLEGFVIESEDDSDTMCEISEDDNDWDRRRGPRFVKKTVVRNGGVRKGSKKDQGRLVNAVILSGPHGCGKTAAVYAVAKELDFEIFEINSSSRRSGKDILEKVGDMTRNHLVQHNRVDSTTDEADETTADDIKSGKQGMMTAFFKPKQAAASSGSRGSKTTGNEGAESSGNKTGSGKAQRQSLILVEEVDILFEEDKQFWATLMGLIAQSKRPFIMTCNDESLVPIQSLSLHGIFRFSAVPSSLAVDLCLLIAANEGHALRRCAVEALYRSRNDDLRATITELQYWCQLGVGDRRGGFDWFHLRWPKGCDLDKNGDVVRVVSEDTYRKGMGWVARDEIATTPDRLKAEEEAMHQSWDSWQCDIGDWCETIDVDSWALHVGSSNMTQQEGKPNPATRKLSVLTAFDAFCGTLSDADVCSSGAYGTKLQEVIDATLPDMPTKGKDDFIIGQVLLDANPVRLQVSTDKAISTSLKSLAREALHSYRYYDDDMYQNDDQCRHLEPLNEERVTSVLDGQFHGNDFQMVRYDLAVAFDPIAVAPKAAPTTHLDSSVFDRALNLIVLDVAPWVRGIMAYEHQLMQRALKLNNLLSKSGKRKRSTRRNTRSALSALEGGERATTCTRRRPGERHFGDCLTMSHVMRTGGERWIDLVLGDADADADAEAEAEESGAASSPAASDELSK